MIAQDTGSAIVGPARADLYWGAGDEAGRIAGRIRHPGRFVMLPREVDLVEAGRQMPLPAPKPKFASTEVAKQDDKSKNETAGTGAVVAGEKGRHRCRIRGSPRSTPESKAATARLTLPTRSASQLPGRSCRGHRRPPRSKS